jgi:hypothetical protein
MSAWQQSLSGEELPCLFAKRRVRTVFHEGDPLIDNVRCHLGLRIRPEFARGDLFENDPRTNLQLHAVGRH